MFAKNSSGSSVSRRDESLVLRIAENMARYKKIAAETPQCGVFESSCAHLILTPVRLYAFDTATFDPMVFDDDSRVTADAPPSRRSTILPYLSDEQTLPKARKASIQSMIIIVPGRRASDLAAAYLPLALVERAFIPDDHTVIIQLQELSDVSSEDPSSATMMSRANIAPRRARGCQQLILTFPNTNNVASDFIALISRFISSFVQRRGHPSPSSPTFIPQLSSAEWDEKVRGLSKVQSKKRSVALSRTSKSRSVVDTWGTRKNVQLLCDVLSGDWYSILDLTFSPETAPADGNWSPIIEAIRSRVVPQAHVVNRVLRPVSLRFESVMDLSADLLATFVDAIESNNMQLIALEITGFSPSFGMAGIHRVLSYVERGANAVAACSISRTVIDEDILSAADLDRVNQMLENISLAVSRSLAAGKRSYLRMPIINGGER